MPGYKKFERQRARASAKYARLNDKMNKEILRNAERQFAADREALLNASNIAEVDLETADPSEHFLPGGIYMMRHNGKRIQVIVSARNEGRGGSVSFIYRPFPFLTFNTKKVILGNDGIEACTIEHESGIYTIRADSYKGKSGYGKNILSDYILDV